MKEFEVWVEKSLSTPARFLGRTMASTFQEACDKTIHRESAYYRNYCPASRSVWGCTLYPTLAEANGYRAATSYTADNILVIRVGDREVLKLPFKKGDGALVIFEAEWLAEEIKEMINRLNSERYEE